MHQMVDQMTFSLASRFLKWTTKHKYEAYNDAMR
jgi:hypothetical protein